MTPVSTSPTPADPKTGEEPNDPTIVQAAVQRTLTAMLDPLDLPGNWTERQKHAYETRRTMLSRTLNGFGIVSGMMAKPTARRAELIPGRDRLLAAKVRIEEMIADAPDYEQIADARERRAEWARQNGLTASLTALQRGVEHFNGQPALPSPLRELLTDVCPHCGHATLSWPGALTWLEQEIATADKQIVEAQMFIDGHLRAARALLGESVTP